MASRTSLNKTDFQSYLRKGLLNPSFNVVEEGSGAYPFSDIQTVTTHVAAVYYSKIQVGPDPSNYYCAFASIHRDAAGTPVYFVWCGDKFFEGTIAEGLKGARERCDAAVKSSAAPINLVSSMMTFYNKFPIPAQREKCNFWTNWRKNSELCEHTSHFLAHVVAKFGESGFCDLLAQKYDEIMTVDLNAGTESSFSVSELAFKVPILIAGDRGAGKTWESRDFANRNNFPLCEFGGHQGIEAVDMLGSFAPLGGSQFVWKDGPISEAFRKAKNEKVVLLIDEVLRIPQRELSLLLTALSPTKNRTYKIRTGRIKQVIQSEDGAVGVEEVLECPCENLCVIATTNVGSEFAVDECDPAVAERFVVIQKDTSVDQLRAILTSIAKEKGYSVDKVNQTISFYNAMKKLVSKGLVLKMPTTRTLSRAFNELSSSEAEIFRAIKAQHLLWVARDSEGTPVEEQVKAVFDVLESSFKK